MSSGDRFQAYIEAIENAAQWHKRTPVEQAEFDRAVAGAFPGGPNLKPGDWVLHPEAGRCQVLAIEDPVVRLGAASGAVLELSLTTSAFAPDAIEKGGERVFSVAPREAH
jgi:hypothetical protein